MFGRATAVFYLLAFLGQVFGEDLVVGKRSTSMIHLVGGRSPSEGNVYVLNNENFYGPVCDDDWNLYAANVVCKQLGYEGATAITTASQFGDVPQEFAMDDTACDGTESTLQECDYNPADNCQPNEGAGVICNPPDNCGNCPTGWVDASHFNSDMIVCFLFAQDAAVTTFYEASDYCQDQGGYLAEPMNEDLNNLLLNFAGMVGEANWWIGLTDAGHEGIWEWQYTESESDFFVWGTGQPDTEAENHEDCVILQASLDLQWADVACNSHYVDNFKVAPLCQLPHS